jgi:hypothetical protein
MHLPIHLEGPETMKNFRKPTLIGLATLGLALAGTAVFADSGPMGGMGHMSGMHGTMAASMHGQASGPAGEQLMTPQERDVLREKMQSAKTPQERQALAASTHAEMERRAKEKGITLPAHGSSQGGMGGMGGMAMNGMGGMHGMHGMGMGMDDAAHGGAGHRH